MSFSTIFQSYQDYEGEYGRLYAIQPQFGLDRMLPPSGSALQIRTGKKDKRRDNFQFKSFKTYVVTHH